jgi:fructosamine-3-kinase
VILPNTLRESVAAVLGTSITGAVSVHGGDINHAARLETRDGFYMLKWKMDAPIGFFAAEAQGLETLQHAGELRVPTVIAQADATHGCPGWLVMAWIATAPAGSKFAENLGYGLAALHRHTSERYGFDQANFIGELPQPNTPTVCWVDFYRDQRLGAQMAIAAQNGQLTLERQKRLDALCARLDDLIPAAITVPSLLHGDLWSGNFLAVGDQPILIDPAVYYGHREVEIAFTELFGGFPARFYAAYREAYPLDPGYERRRALYQLYPLLTHMNMFGGGYPLQVDAVCRQYI